MELRHLRHFVGIATCGSFSEAAKFLNISQPALTRSVHILEDLLQSQLLDRSSRGITLTEPGRVLFRHAKLILNELVLAEEGVAAVETGTLGVVHFGVASYFVNRIVDQAVASAIQKNREISTSVTVGLYEEMADMLHDGRLDFIVSTNPDTARRSEIVFEPLFDISSFIVASVDHHLAKKNEVPIGDLLDEPWVMLKTPHMESFINIFFGAADLPSPRSKVLTNSLEMVGSMVLQGGCLAFLPYHWIEESIVKKRLKILNVPNTPIERRAGLVYRKSRLQSKASELVMEEIRTAFKLQEVIAS